MKIFAIRRVCFALVSHRNCGLNDVNAYSNDFMGSTVVCALWEGSSHDSLPQRGKLFPYDRIITSMVIC